MHSFHVFADSGSSIPPAAGPLHQRSDRICLERWILLGLPKIGNSIKQMTSPNITPCIVTRLIGHTVNNSMPVALGTPGVFSLTGI